MQSLLFIRITFIGLLTCTRLAGVENGPINLKHWSFASNEWVFGGVKIAALVCASNWSPLVLFKRWV